MSLIQPFNRVLGGVHLPEGTCTNEWIVHCTCTIKYTAKYLFFFQKRFTRYLNLGTAVPDRRCVGMVLDATKFSTCEGNCKFTRSICGY